MTTSWSRSYCQEITASPEKVWAVLADVSTWKEWNAGVEAIEIEGSFASGVWFSMVLPDNEVIRSQLIDVSAPLRFVDATWIGETVVRVIHSIELLPMDRCRATFTANAEGPEAQDIGDGASADFPEVLASLAKYVEKR
jgi:uncharacterized protein YndB with AHSA1/START domain